MSLIIPTPEQRRRTILKRVAAAVAVLLLFVIVIVFDASSTAERQHQKTESPKPEKPAFKPTSAPSREAEPEPPARTTFDARVTDVASGDTVTVVDRSGQKFSVHLGAVNAPMQGQSFSTEAKDNLSKLCLNKDVTVVVQRTGPQGVLSARVVQKGTDVGLEQLRQGFALLDKAEAAVQMDDVRSNYTAAEENARRLGSGFWSGTGTISTAARQPQEPALTTSPELSRFSAPTQETAAPVSVANVPAKPSSATPVRAELNLPALTIKPAPAAKADQQPFTKTMTGNPAPPTGEAKTDITPKQPSSPASLQDAVAGRKYVLGPRGGCYYMSDPGRKVYVDHARCQ